MSGDPARWLDDEGAPPELRRDLGRAASMGAAGYSPEAGLARFEAALASGAAVTIAKGKAAGGAAKLWWLVGGGGSGVMVAALVAWGAGRAPAHTASAPVPPPSVIAATPPAEAPTASLAESPSPSPSTSPSAAAAAAAAAATTTTRTATSAPSRPDADAVRAELAQLARIRSLVSTDPSAALAGAREGDHTFSRGLLHQEREVVAIDALVALGRSAEAASRARSFLRVYPNGPYSEHVRGIAGADR